MLTFVLVHGAWHGGWCWSRVARLLHDAGHTVYAPSLTGLGDRVHLARPEVDLALHGHIHRANAWQLTAGSGSLVVASAGALVNDGRRDASYLEIVDERGRLAVWRRSVSTGRPTVLYEGARNAHR